MIEAVLRSADEVLNQHKYHAGRFVLSRTFCAAGHNLAAGILTRSQVCDTIREAHAATLMAATEEDQAYFTEVVEHFTNALLELR
jgi:hypothetical protein